jgi:hypothetical protein
LGESELTIELKNKIEAWIDGDAWSTYSIDYKNKVADALSAYMKAHDGTPQVIVREFGTNKMLAEILGDYRDFNYKWIDS